ncbi:uncharacterized protein KD926_009990 [Aspergillus affinis]|uniref:uncharacterized protein n=1 Tax=Aspergillus affinis TaxID=1070780 RepID=UPI0022FE4E52|nr:uncharacterized protein KD926_009990 [Aspergillus affinis]KAI9039006.1 hypothetical protein KD926_009990 [Aspergillus affinis]
MLASSMMSPALGQIKAEFNDSTQTLITFTVSIYIISNAVGPLVLAPLSETYGRCWIYHAGNVMYTAFSAGCALSPNASALLALRLLAGLAGSIPVTTVGGTIADMVVPERRGLINSILGATLVFAPTLAPVAGGFLAESQGWRWIFWLVTIVSGLTTMLGFALLRETYNPVLLQRKAARLRQESGNDQVHTHNRTDELPFMQKLGRALRRPVVLHLASPILIIASLYLAFIYGVTYLLITSMPLVFRDVYGWGEGALGLSSLSLGVGCFIGISLTGRYSDQIYQRQKERSGDANQAESRLFFLLPAAVSLPTGLLMYGWTVHFQTHWIAPLIGTATFGAGMALGTAAMSSYLIDAFSTYAASALAGGLLPLSGPGMYERLGYGWGNTLLGLLSVLFGGGSLTRSTLLPPFRSPEVSSPTNTMAIKVSPSDQQIEQRPDIESQILNALFSTPYSCLSLKQLSGGLGNFTFQGTLEVPLSHNRRSVIIKLSLAHTKTGTLVLPTIRCAAEAVSLSIIYGCDFTHNHLEIRSPRHLHLDTCTNLQVIEDIPNIGTLRKFLFLNNVLPDSTARLIGHGLGRWLAAFHARDWSQAGDDAIATFHRNTAALRTLTMPYEYAMSLFPNDSLARASVLHAFSPDHPSRLCIIHGDYTTRNFLVQPSKSPKDVNLSIVDWELCRHGCITEDVGSMITSLYVQWRFEGSPCAELILRGFIRGYGLLDESLVFRMAGLMGIHLLMWEKLGLMSGGNVDTRAQELQAHAKEFFINGAQKNIKWLMDCFLGQSIAISYVSIPTDIFAAVSAANGFVEDERSKVFLGDATAADQVPILHKPVQAWRMAGVAAKLCLELGIHLGRFFNGALVHPDRFTDVKRLFACVYDVDRRCSFYSNLPWTLHDRDIDMSTLRLKLVASLPTGDFTPFEPTVKPPPWLQTGLQRFCRLRVHHIKMLNYIGSFDSLRGLISQPQAARALISSATESVELHLEMMNDGGTSPLLIPLAIKFLLSAVSFMILVVSHYPEEYGPLCTKPFHAAIEILHNAQQSRKDPSLDVSSTLEELRRIAEVIQLPSPPPPRQLAPVTLTNGKQDTDNNAHLSQAYGPNVFDELKPPESSLFSMLGDVNVAANDMLYMDDIFS